MQADEEDLQHLYFGQERVQVGLQGAEDRLADGGLPIGDADGNQLA